MNSIKIRIADEMNKKRDILEETKLKNKTVLLNNVKRKGISDNKFVIRN